MPSVEPHLPTGSGTGVPSPPALHVSPSPHLHDRNATTRGAMRDVLIGLLPVVVAGVLVFGWRAVSVLATCVASCLAVEEVLTRWRGRRSSIGDLSAAVTGTILALSLPATVPAWVAVIACSAAVGVGKLAFGALGQNVFNPAMVGRAFVMLSFTKFLGAPAYQVPDVGGIISMATPLTLAREAEATLPDLWALTVGTVNGSIGEVSVIACVLGGLFLCLRGTASWVIPLTVAGGLLVPATLNQLLVSEQSLAVLPPLQLTALQHLTSGALMFGAFFIATDPVTSPITRHGEAIFGAGVGLLVWVFRTFSSYPEGVMFAVLLMNAVVPLINRWTVPTPFGDRPATAPLSQRKTRS